MKINILSDLHLDYAPMDRPVNEADLVVLAGDISRPREAVAWALRLGKPVLYVAGNHEFYGGSIDATQGQLRMLCAGTALQFLDCDETVIQGVRFLGATLWTDFALFGESRRAAAMELGRRALHDFSHIRLREGQGEPFRPSDAAALFDRHAAWLGARLAAPHPGPTVVVSHHAPAPQSIHRRFEGSPINPCFVSDAWQRLGAGRADLWIHGHTHDSFDYRIDSTRVVCNPRGYVRGATRENPNFDPHFVVEIESGAPAERSR
ncbi:MAG: metallophosphoesterase family protein [Burkholderiales bacterium]|nr:metallophosphoesterase family protein [Burkholderiales bacterium]MDE2394840.1 metallophosphoesterase family protein [Burkholderiales bacterium]MDE2457131.1 metallophosphoesterase family protein [Burkholderiales bacterium]